MQWAIQGRYLALAGGSLAAWALAMAGPAPALTPWGRAAELFEASPVDPERYAVLARPLGNGEWTLLVLEQIRPAPLCWQRRPDGLVDPTLNRFDFTGVCGRYLDSNGYSVRLAERDGGGLTAGPLRLRVEESGSELRLLASSPGVGGELPVGGARIPARDRDGFVALRLNPGWQLQRRRYGEQILNHLYFAHAASAEQLLAAAGGRPGGTGGMDRAGAGYPALLPPPPPLPINPSAPPRGDWAGRSPMGAASLAQTPPDREGESRVVALQVVPFQE